MAGTSSLAAIEDEKKSLQENKTWKLVPKAQAKGKKILSNTWVLTIKGSGKHKARLVVRGDQQIFGENFDETYSPVVSNEALRIILAIASSKEYGIVTFDVKTAFLHGNLDEDIYMFLPQSYKNENDMVCKLLKSLYGLRQASRQWNAKFTDILKKLNLREVTGERCVFVGTDIILAIHVDDGIIVFKNKNKADNLLMQLQQEFKITIDKNPTEFLGMEIIKNNSYECLEISQNKYTREVLEKFGMAEARPVDTPAIGGERPDNDQKNQNFPYRQAVGRLLYLSSRSRPDITYSVNIVSRYMEHPTNFDVTRVKRIMRYLNGGTTAIKYNGTLNNDLQAYCDSDYAGDTKSRKSTSGWVIMFKGGPIAWGTQKQSVTATSSCEAEFISACSCVKVLLYLKAFIQDLTGSHIKASWCEKPVKATIFEDNKGAIDLIKNGILNKRSKHIEVRFHFITEKIREKQIEIKYIPTSEQIADIFTKPLLPQKFKTFKDKIVHDIQ